MAKKILVVGSINQDLVLCMPRMLKPGESLICSQYFYSMGGKGANAAVAAARLGGAVDFCGQVGTDETGQTLRQTLNDEGVGTAYMAPVKGCATGLAVIFLEDDGSNRIAVYPQANTAPRPEGWLSALPEDYDAVMMQLEIPQDVILETAAWAGAKGIPVVLDAGPAQAFPLEQMRGMAILSPNETETQALTGILPDAGEAGLAAAKKLMERGGAKYVVIKLGAQGCLVYDGSAATHIPPYPVKAVDTTACGDAFTGALTLNFLETGDILAAARYANAVGALTATGKGAMPSLPTSEAVKAFLKKAEE